MNPWPPVFLDWNSFLLSGALAVLLALTWALASLAGRLLRFFSRRRKDRL